MKKVLNLMVMMVVFALSLLVMTSCTPDAPAVEPTDNVTVCWYYGSKL